MSRGPVLDTAAIEVVVVAVGRMRAPVTWTAVVETVAAATGHAYTRQALAKHPCVLAAVQERRAGGPERTARRRRPRDPLREELDRLKAQLWKLEEQLILIAENALALGISEEILLAPVPMAASRPPAGEGGTASRMERVSELLAGMAKVARPVPW